MRTLSEVFSKYTPGERERRFFDAVKEYTVKKHKERPIYEISVRLDRIFDKDTIYGVEAGIAAAYDGYTVKFMPSYPSGLLDSDYIPEILREAEHVGCVARGFFGGCEARLEGGRLDIAIPFTENGVGFINDAKTPAVIENIIRSEFGISVPVTIRELEGAPLISEMSRNAMFEEMDRRSAEAAQRYESESHRRAAQGDGGNGKYQNRNGKPAGDGDDGADAPEVQYKRIYSAYDEDVEAVTEDGMCTIGSAVFDISAPEYIIGDPFEIEPQSISSLRSARKRVCIVGEVCSFKCEEARGGGGMFITFGIFDGNATIEVRTRRLEAEDAQEISDTISNGMIVAAVGDVRPDKNSPDMLFYYSAIAKIKRLPREDTAEEKRVELHLHTNMSAMDALISPADAVNTAKRWGHKAVAVTDHANVQGFPEAMIAAEKAEMKVIYGLEAYFVNDSASPLFGEWDRAFSDEVVVFDIETTGLSVVTCKITEIGAVKIRDGKVVDRYSTFVNPECHIPEEITELTSITDDMVKDAPTVREVLPEFLAFVGDDLLVAHNAGFDTGFIRYVAKEQGIEFDSPYLDTVALSRYVNTDLKVHKLDAVAKYFGLGDFNHHRAVDDAEMLGLIYLKMLEKLEKFGIEDYGRLVSEIHANTDPLTLKTYHMIILVKNLTGLKNLYKLVSLSYLKYYRRVPRIPKSELDKLREGLIIGSACEAGELFSAIVDNRSDSDIEDIASYYDYLEIQPIGNNHFMVDEGRVPDEEALRDYNRRIVAIGEKLGKPVVATSDAHFLDPEDEIYRHILLAGMKFKDADKSCQIYFHTTDEMLREFAYLGEKKAHEVVIDNPNAINDMVEEVRPIPKGSFPPHLDGAEEELTEKCWTRAHNMYGDELPEIVSSRLERELGSIIKNGFAVLYVIAEKLVHFSESQGYLVGSRGSVGSSFVATMAGISEVNPLPPHYYCPKCRYSDFSNPDKVGSGFDMPTRNCPVCGEKLAQDGQDIPFETFLGFYGEKSPDIDLNFSGEVQGRVHKFTEELFGSENVFRAGTLGTLADKTAYGFVAKYFESKGESVCRAEADRIISHCVGVKRTTGQHPGGIIVVPREKEVYDFTPIQHPADDPKSDIITTHFAFSYLHDTILKLDELGHDIPTKYKFLEKYSGISVMDVAMNDRTVYELFATTESIGIPQMDVTDKETKMLGLMIGTLGLPEMGTSFIQQVLVDAKPKNFADLMQISGLTHGTDVWLGNAQDLIKNGICDISHVVGTRDGIMLDLIRYGVDKNLSFKIMEMVRKNKKGKPIPEEMVAAMREKEVPEWYIDSLRKIKYMFPKAHAAAYVMSAIRLGWYKVHQPVAFYCAILTVAPEGFDATVVARGRRAVVDTMRDINARWNDATQKEKDLFGAMQFANECMLRNIKFLPVSLEHSHAKEFLPEDGNIRMPFMSLPGVGENAALAIMNAREDEPYFSVEDLQLRAKLNKSVIEILRTNGVLDRLSETAQISMFDLF